MSGPPRDKNGRIRVCPQQHRDILDIIKVLEGVSLDSGTDWTVTAEGVVNGPRVIKRALITTDLYRGAHDHKDIAAKVNLYRPLIGVSKRITEGGVNTALYLLRSINKERDKDTRYGKTVNCIRFALPNGKYTGERRYWVQAYENDPIEPGDVRMTAYREGDKASAQYNLSTLNYRQFLAEVVFKNATDERQQLLAQAQLGRVMTAIAEEKLASRSF